LSSAINFGLVLPVSIWLATSLNRFFIFSSGLIAGFRFVRRCFLNSPCPSGRRVLAALENDAFLVLIVLVLQVFLLLYLMLSLVVVLNMV